MNFLGKGPSPGHSPESKRFWGHENPLKMHILSIHFISFTAQIYNTLHMQDKKGDFGILGRAWPLSSPKSAYDITKVYC